ncbi:hypothetical protein D3C81_984920 [compost metagenome]
MGDIALARRPHHGAVEFELGVVQLRLQVVDPGDGRFLLAAGAEVAFDQLVDAVQIPPGGDDLRLERAQAVLERRRVDAKQHIALLQRLVALDRHLDHFAGDHRDHRHRDEIRTRYLRIRVVVVHGEDQRTDHDDATEYRSGHGPFVQRDAKQLEDRHADRGVGKDQ